MHTVLWSLLTSLTWLSIVVAQCPTIHEPCRCTPSIYEPVAIVCENAGSLHNVLQSIQPAKQTSIDSLTIIDTAVSSIPANAFMDFTIIRLVFNRNTLQFVDDQAFNGPLLYSLIELDLTDNNIGEIPQTGLTRLRNLRKLYLSRNRINTLMTNAFANYESKNLLVKLSLAGNRLTDQSLTDTSVFRPLKLLQELSLETNALTAIPSMALINQRATLINLNLGLNNITEVPVGALDFPNLMSLSLEFNGITNIPPQSFQGVPYLQYLYLTGNKFSSWTSEMFRYITQLKTLGIGETPITVIPNNAFMYIPNLIRLEMSEAAVDTIERGAFQRAPHIQAIVLNKNRLSQIRADFFDGLSELYSIDVQGNRIENVEPFGFANLPSLSHLDISYNQLESLSKEVFMNSFLPQPNDRRVIYCCGNPWYCNSELLWLRQLFRDNLDIDIEKPGCQAICTSSPSGCPAQGTPLRAVDFCLENEEPQPYTGQALALVGWIILAIIMTIFLISICLLAMVRYGMSHRRKKQKDQEFEDDARMMSSAASLYGSGGGGVSAIDRPYSTLPPLNLDLPPAHTLDDRPSNYFY